MKKYFLIFYDLWSNLTQKQKTWRAIIKQKRIIRKNIFIYFMIQIWHKNKKPEEQL